MLKLSVAPPYIDASLAMSDLGQLNDWLRQRPLGQPLECAEQLRQALEQLNRARLPTAQRAKLLDRHQQEHKILLPLLERLAANGELSTQHRARHAARLAQHLALALHNGYKLLAMERSEEHGLLALDKYKTEALCLAMRSARQLAFLYARTYSTLPEGFWLDCHRLFFHALEKGWENIPLPGQAKSPAHYYRQTLLLGMTASNRMAPALIDYSLLLIRKHADQLDLLHLGHLTSGHGSFAFQPGSDHPPRFISEAPDSPSAQGIWVVDTHSLEAELKSKLQKLQYLARHQQSPFEVEEEIQHVLYLTMEWQSAILRRHERLPSEEEVELVSSLSTIWYMTNGAAWTFPNGEALPQELLPDNGMHGKLQRMPPPLPVRMQVVNTSASGMLLRGEAQYHPLRAGELLLLRGSSQPWQLAVVRWVNLCGEQMETECGVELVGPQPEAVMTLPLLTHPNDHYHMALRLPAAARPGKQPQLVLGGRQYQRQREFYLLDRQGRQVVSSTSLSLQTAGYQFMEYRPAVLSTAAHH
ncbi:hypothetical protein [Vogesella sp. LIG4]|uniref:hypothetical protein n=1 Tax=Vogesella sp. LIG4 TaxID=1192162 RepID=UPI00081F981A|nr:hypothetical protein [Vogesella sp. LIG4]SCK14863.1 hypothetical protein PSELUDRAFT_1457 [Vogesella sp. LIG4]